MSLATTSPAWNLSTDSHQIIRPLPPRSHHDTGEPRTSPYRRFYIIGTAGTCLAGLTLVVYPLAAFGYEIHRVLLTLLMVAMLAGAVVGAIAFMTVLAVRTVDRLCARRLAATRADLGFDLAATVTGLQHDLGQRLGEVERDRAELQNLLRQQVATNRDLLVRVERLAKEHTGFARAVAEQLGRIESGVDEFRQRLDGVEQQVEQQAEQVEDLVSVAKVFAVTDVPDAQVRVLHRPNGHTPAPRRGR